MTGLKQTPILQRLAENGGYSRSIMHDSIRFPSRIFVLFAIAELGFPGKKPKAGDTRGT
jgi:hypothetical protein